MEIPITAAGLLVAATMFTQHLWMNATTEASQDHTSRIEQQEAPNRGQEQVLAAVGRWGAYVMDATSDKKTMKVTFNEGIINGEGGHFDNANGRIYVPKAGIYRAIVYLDFHVGNSGSERCTDIRVQAFDADGTEVNSNCDDVGRKDSVRQNACMQVIWHLPKGGYFTIETGNEAIKGTVSVEQIRSTDTHE